MSIESRKHQYGRVFGHWQIKEFLGSGSGGKSAVFRLEHTESPGVESALKVISLIEERGRIGNYSPERQNEYAAARHHCSERAEKEVLLMNDLQGNTNIVDYLDHTFVDWSDETGFGRDMLIRMEKLSDLRSLINTGRHFDREEILKIGRDICTALILCHKKGILHRDIKPENIFINKNGSYKLGDFGISRIVNTTSSAVASTGIGTPQYWAPEQTSGKYDVRVDIYSLGLVLYELSNKNRLPFAQSSYVRDEQIHRRLLGETLPTPCNADASLARVILKACAFHPEDRYQSAEDFLRALDHVDSISNYDTMPAQNDDLQQKYHTVPAKADQPQPAGPVIQQPAENIQTQAKGIPLPEKKTRIAAICAVLLTLVILGYFCIHIWTDASCTEPSICRICGKEKQEALGHTWVAADCTHPRSCSTCGTTEGNPAGHNWQAATCSTPQTCSVCDISEGGPADHIWKNATCTTPQTCASCGETVGELLEHFWAVATCTTPQTCSICGTTLGEPLEHAWVEATCTEPVTCVYCGTTSGDAMGHNWTDATFTNPKTCIHCDTTEGEPLPYSHISVEDEVLLIREQYSTIQSNIASSKYYVDTTTPGLAIYYDDFSNIVYAVVYRGTDGIGHLSDMYNRFYYFADEQLIFAYYEGVDAHRLYFYDELLMRWLYRPVAESADHLEIYDFTFSDEYMMMEEYAKSESRFLLGKG